MNLKNLEEIRQTLQTGSIITQKTGRPDGSTRVWYTLRFNPNAIRMILPKTIPYLRQKKGRALVLSKFLQLRGNGTMKGRLDKDRVVIEKKYLDLEADMDVAMLVEKPWLLTAKTRRGNGRKHKEKMGGR